MEVVREDEQVVEFKDKDAPKEDTPGKDALRKLSTQMEKIKQERLAREQKSLLAWTNTYLKSRGYEATTLSADFRDGVLLINLLEGCFGEKIVSSYNSRPKLDYHKLDNLTHVFTYLEKHAISTQSIDPHDLLKGKEKQTIVLLWNILRKMTLRGLDAIKSVSGGDSDDKKSKDNTVKSMLLKWTNDTLKNSGISYEVNDLWDSLKDGIALSALIEDLAPGSIKLDELKPENAVENLRNAFQIAETQLGIPSLLAVEDFEAGKEPDEKAVENYLCMLVSAQKAQVKRDEAVQKLKKQMTMMQEEKEKEVEELRTKMDEEKHAMESLQADIMSLKLQYQTASSSEAKLQEEIEKASQEKSVLFQKLEELQKFGEKTQTLLQASHSKELELVAELTALRAMNEKLEATLKEKYDENALLNSELYKSYREYEDVLNGFRDKMIERSKAESDQYSAETQEHFNEMMEQSILEQKGFEDFMNSLKPRKGWLMKQRPKGKKKFGKQRKRWFELKGDTLYWYKNRDDPSPQGSINLKWFERTDNGIAALGKMDLFSLEARRTASISVSASGSGAGAANPLAIDLKPNSLKGNPARGMRLIPVASLADEYQVDIHSWAEDINDRIALIKYLSDMYEKKKLKAGRIQGCRELVNFISDGGATLLKIENRVAADFHNALFSFKESLMMRKHLNILFNKSAFADEDVSLLSEIVSFNNTMKVLTLTGNFLSDKSTELLGKALQTNYSLEEFDISYNKIGDAGVKHLAAGLAKHSKLRRLGLSGCGISDQGARDFAEAFGKAFATYKTHHDFPIIELSRNAIKDEGGIVIAKLCVQNPRIKAVFLDYNLLTDETALAFADAITDGSHLNELMLAGNMISSKGAVKLAEVIGRLDKVFTVDLSHNSLIGRQGFSSFFSSTSPIKMDLFKLTMHASADVPPSVAAQSLLSVSGSKRVTELEARKAQAPEPEIPEDVKEAEPAPRSSSPGSSRGSKKSPLRKFSQRKADDDDSSEED